MECLCSRWVTLFDIFLFMIPAEYYGKNSDFLGTWSKIKKKILKPYQRLHLFSANILKTGLNNLCHVYTASFNGRKISLLGLIGNCGTNLKILQMPDIPVDGILHDEMKCYQSLFHQTSGLYHLFPKSKLWQVTHRHNLLIIICRYIFELN